MGSRKHETKEIADYIKKHNIDGFKCPEKYEQDISGKLKSKTDVKPGYFTEKDLVSLNPKNNGAINAAIDDNWQRVLQGFVGKFNRTMMPHVLKSASCMF